MTGSSWRRLLPAALLPLALVACSSSSSGTNQAALCAAPGGAVAGDADSHCADSAGPIAQPVDETSCNPDGGAPMELDGGMAEEEPRPPRDTAAGDDDDCKYHVAWTSTPICRGSDVTFTVTVTRTADGAPATGADPYAEALLGDTHPAPNTGQTVVETTPGVYTVGPVRFDAAGRWTLRFHLYEECADTLEDSPHGHIAFHVDVP